MARGRDWSAAPPGRPPDPFSDPVASALIEVIDERGYAATEVGAVVARAGVERAEFDRRFADKEDCVLKVFEAFIADFLWHIQSAYDTQDCWPDSLRAAAWAAADWIDRHPRTAAFGSVDVLNARDEMTRVRREQAFQYCAGLIDRGREVAPDRAAVPEAAAVMAIGAVAQILTLRLGQGEDLEIERMAPLMMYGAVRPYLGEEAARRELSVPRPEPPSANS
jgi:AcrR family transcriptional regulator